MGLIGSAVGSFVGEKLGKRLLGKKGKKIGGLVGKVAGGLLPYETGGMVKGPRKGKAVQIIAHTGEWVLPIGVKPTKAQKAQIAIRKKK